MVEFHSDKISMALGGGVIVCGILVSFSEPMFAVLIGALGGVMLQIRWTAHKVYMPKGSMPEGTVVKQPVTASVTVEKRERRRR